MAAPSRCPLGHLSRATGFEPVAPGNPDADNPLALGPAGRVHTTLEDYVRFMQAHIAGARGVPGLNPLVFEAVAQLHQQLFLVAELEAVAQQVPCFPVGWLPIEPPATVHDI